MGLASEAGRAAAQTGIPLHYTPVDVATYRTLDECIAAVQRLMRELKLAYPPQQTWEPRPDTVQKVADRCASAPATPRADSALVPSTYQLESILWLYAMAHRDADAAKLVARQLAQRGVEDSLRQVVADGLLFDGYRQAHRPTEVRAILERRLQRATGMDSIVEAHWALQRFADEIGDTALALKHTADLITDAEKINTPTRSTFVFSALARLRRKELLDSLTHSTASYWALLLSFQKRVYGFGDVILTKMPPVVGDFWFSRSGGGNGNASQGPRPVPGRTNLVVFFSSFANAIGFVQEGWLGTQCKCSGLPALSKRLPNLEITLVARTSGRLEQMAHPDPAEEAELLRKWLHDSEKLPGVLAVAQGPFRRLPAPDGRVLFQTDSNAANYTATQERTTIFLIDHDGYLVESGDSLAAMEEMIDATLKQRPARGGATPP